MKIFGIKVRYYVKSMNFQIKFILCCLTDKKEKIAIEIDEHDLKINKVSSFNGFSLIPKSFSNISISDTYINDSDGILVNKDLYYRYLLNNIDVFSKTMKYKEKRPVWFFKGSNSKAKNYIADKTNISKFYIDKYNFIPDLIECDIIVFPDNYVVPDNTFTNRCIGNNEYISVSFETKMNNNIKYMFRNKRYIYIFIGEPNIGKKYIANSLGLEIFETDKYTVLPERIEENIIIMGKTKVYDIDLDIIPRFRGDCRFIYVEFNYINI